MKAKLFNIAVVIAGLLLSACSVSQTQLQQEHDLVSALRDVNKADREVTRQESMVKVSTVNLAAANAALAKAKQNQQSARDNFNALYSASTAQGGSQPAQQ